MLADCDESYAGLHLGMLCCSELFALVGFVTRGKKILRDCDVTNLGTAFGASMVI